MAGANKWLGIHREGRPYAYDVSVSSPPPELVANPPKLLRDEGFNNHEKNDGSHVSPYDTGQIHWGTEGIQVNLLQGVDEAQLKKVLSRTLRATTGVSPDETTDVDTDAVEMFSGGLQSALVPGAAAASAACASSSAARSPVPRTAAIVPGAHRRG